MTQAADRYDPSIKEADEVARDLRSDLERGLTAQEASRRLADQGPNELRAAPPIPKWRRIGWPGDAIVIALVVVVNAVIGYVQEAKAESAVAALAKMTAVASAVIRDARVM